MIPRRRLLRLVAAAVPILHAGACGGSAADRPARKVALLLPESKTTRYETHDRPLFEAKLGALCPGCEIIYGNAEQSASRQQAQAEAALANGAGVLVLDPVDGAAARGIAERARAQGVAVIAYDRLILGTDAVDFYISFDNEKVGRMQGEALLDALAGRPSPRVVMINGSPTDNNATLNRAGARRALAGRATIVREYDIADWSPDKAQEAMTQALTALGDRIDGVRAANDGTAGGVIAALKAAGIRPLPPVTGQDAELAAIQRILAGEQYMTVYRAIRPEAEVAAEIAFHLVSGTPVPAALTGGRTVDNGRKAVPAVLLEPVAVTVRNVGRTVVRDGFWSVRQLCTPAFAAACRAAGLE